MATQAFETLVPKLSPSVPGCPHYTMVQYIRDAAIRVCERTLSWRHAQPTFSLDPGVHEYAYNKPAGTDVHAVFSAVVNGHPLRRLTLDQALEEYPEWTDVFSGVDISALWDHTTSGTLNTPTYNDIPTNSGGMFVAPDGAYVKTSTPQVVVQLTPDKYVILPSPDTEKVYTMRMFYALKPSRGAGGMDARILDELQEAIIHSALQHLLALPNVVWADRELAAYHARQSIREVTERRARANLGNARGSMRAMASRFS